MLKGKKQFQWSCISWKYQLKTLVAIKGTQLYPLSLTLTFTTIDILEELKFVFKVENQLHKCIKSTFVCQSLLKDIFV